MTPKQKLEAFKAKMESDIQHMRQTMTAAIHNMKDDFERRVRFIDERVDIAEQHLATMPDQPRFADEAVADIVSDFDDVVTYMAGACLGRRVAPEMRGDNPAMCNSDVLENGKRRSDNLFDLMNDFFGEGQD
ncbi:hypothetical protein ASE85_03335 [Sphingobium sp. Leaf26]|uniref:hypothetical protein n=1 Tax=Sphingobium sp. Leaf26 TaxID=1735693 RepID=UPI0006F8BB24|nr:hypothetical protein [Sphingobium sp. Leaf26]KQN09977.1 hypothetical protein ASE85_03335 [Sphingobium sp. Leaf26]